MENPPKWDETEEVVVSKAKVPSWDDTEELPVKKKEPSAKSEPSTSDSRTPSPLLEKSGEDKSFTERIATNNLPQTFAKQQTKQKSDAEILAEKKAKVTQKEGGFDLAKSTTDLIGGINRAITNAPAEIAKTGAELINYGGNKINKVFGIEETKIEDNPVYKLADSYSNWMDNNVYEDVDKESLPSQIGSGLGQAATMIATGGGSTVSKGLANASKVAKAIKSSVVPFSQVFNSEYEGMKDAGESEDVAFEQAIVNATATTPLEKLPIANLFTRYKKYIGSDLSKRALTASAQALEEGTTEGLQQVFSNLTNNQLVELDANTKEWNKDVGNSAEVGGYVGLILGTISSVAQGRLKGRKDGGVQVQEPTEQSATITEGTQPSDVITEQQEPIVQSTSPAINKGTEQIAKVEQRSVPEITQMSGSDVESLVQERLNPTKEDVPTIATVQESTTSTVEQPAITGAQEQDGTTGVQSVSENIQKTGTADVENMPISEKGEQNKITNEPTKEQDVQVSVLDQSGATDSDIEKGAKQVKEKSLLNKAYKGQTESQIKEAIAGYGLTYEVESRVEAKGIADGIISDIGLENAIKAVNRFEIQGAPAAFVLARGLDYLQAEILKENSPEQLESLMKQQAVLVDSLDVKGRTGGRFSSALDEIYRGDDFNFNFDLERQKQQYKDANNGELPKAVEDKMIQLDTELKEVSKKLKETEDKVRLLEEQNAVDSIKADISKTTAKKQRRGKALIAEGLDDIAEALGITLMASGDKRTSVVNGLAKIGQGMIEEGVATIENVSEKLKEFVSQKLKGKIDFDEYQNEVIASINLEPEIKSGSIKIKQSVIRRLVEEGANNIDELVAQLIPIARKQYQEATEREIRDAVTSYGKIVNPQRDEIDVKIGKMKRIGRLISALEDVKEKKRPLKSGVQREKIDAEERALSKTLREAMKELPMDLESQERQLKTILESTKQRLRNQIEDLNREISTKEQIPKSAKAFRSDDEIAELKKQRDELKKQHDDIFKNDDYKEKLRLDIAKRNAEKKIADFERRIKERDLSVKRRKQVEADKELNKLKIKQLELKDEFIKLQYENELKNRTRRQKVIDGLFEAWGLTRALRATGEMSFILLQGGVYTVSHPVSAAKAFTTAMSHFGSETRADNWLRKLKTTEQYMIMKESKLALVEPDAKLSVREEQFLGGWVNHIWDFGGYPFKMAGEKAYENWKKANPIKAIERAGVGYMNTLRVERFLQGEIMLQEQGKTILNNKEDYKNMADVINTFTGRATLGAFESVSKPLSAIFFSPRNWASTIKTATPYGLYHFGKMTTKTESGKIAVSVAQKMAVRDFMTFVGATGAIVSLAAVALADDDDEKTGVEFDPTSSDFMKIKLGNTRVDPWGGKIQQVILLSRLMTQSMKKADGKSYVLGYGNTSSSGELLAKMATNKLAPSASILNKLLFADKKKVKGEYVLSVPFEGEYDAAEQLAANLYPIYWDSIKETYAEQPEVLASFLSALAFMGMGVNTYEQKQKKDKPKD